MNEERKPVVPISVRIYRIAILYAALAILWFTVMAVFGPAGTIGTDLLYAGYGIGAVLSVLNIVALVVLFGVTMILRRTRLSRAVELLGIRPWSGPAIVPPLLAIGVAAIVLYAFGYRGHERSVMALIPFDFLGPFVEEAIFRGFLFKQLRHWAGIPFWLAAVLASVPFAMEHIYQGATTVALLEIFAITFLGGIIFCWLVEQWGSIWSSWVLHSGLNFLFSVFPLGIDASENLVGNIERLSAIVCAILVTWIMTKSKASTADARIAQATSRPADIS